MGVGKEDRGWGRRMGLDWVREWGWGLEREWDCSWERMVELELIMGLGEIMWLMELIISIVVSNSK